MEREENNVCGWLTESEHVGIVIMYDSRVGTECQDKLCAKIFSIFCDLPGTLLTTTPFCLWPLFSSLHDSVCGFSLFLLFYYFLLFFFLEVLSIFFFLIPNSKEGHICFESTLRKHPTKKKKMFRMHVN